jgi:queuine tRNA-ribosyltransferase
LIDEVYWADAREPHHDREHIHLKKACFMDDPRPISATCPCPTCQNFSRSYLHHLIKAKEILALTALTVHNIVFMTRFMEQIRAQIAAGEI